jgi:hypothetical protein
MNSLIFRGGTWDVGFVYIRHKRLPFFYVIHIGDFFGLQQITFFWEMSAIPFSSN